MNKADLIAAIADATDQTKDAVGRTIDKALISIAAALVRGEEVTLTGFETFSVTDRPARQGITTWFSWRSNLTPHWRSGRPQITGARRR